jgi:hypothetical protein
MSITYGYFNSLNGDRSYNADQMSEYFDGLVSDGVFEDVGGALQVIEATTSGNWNVAVKSGRALIDCKWMKNDADALVTITQSSATLSRYTAIVVRLDRTNRTMTIQAKDGTPASSPQRITMTDNENIKEICLAQILVPAGSVKVSQSNIYDMRPSSQCGWVTGLIKQVDTSQLFLQWETAYAEFYTSFQEWFATLTQQLEVGAFLKEYKKVVNGGAGVSRVIPLDMVGYTFEASDIFNVYINGLKALENTDYNVGSDGVTVFCDMTTGNVVEIQVFKNVIGNPGGSRANEAYFAYGSTNADNVDAYNPQVDLLND